MYVQFTYKDEKTLLLYLLHPEHPQDSPGLAGLSFWGGLLSMLHQEKHTPAPAQETQGCFKQ